MLEIYCLFGATASGKSSYAIKLAKKRNFEIIAMDAFQIYQDINILSAAPTTEEVKLVPHHLFSFLKAKESFSVACWYQKACIKILDIWQRQKTPLLVGGTGLYLRVIQNGLDTSANFVDSKLRTEILNWTLNKSNLEVWQRLNSLWPERAKELHYNDKKRITRAIEIALSKQVNSQKENLNYLRAYLPTWRKIWLNPDREQLYQNINQRVYLMQDKGIVAEVKKLLSLNLEAKHTLSQAIGYQETLDFINQKLTKEEWIASIQQNSRNFAKKQLTWFKKESNALELKEATYTFPWD